MAAEIGGSNGMRAFGVATALDIPVIDADEIGRAFPRVDMSLPFVYKAAHPCPAVLSDARANTQVVVSTENATKFENMVSYCHQPIYEQGLIPITGSMRCSGAWSVRWSSHVDQLRCYHKVLRSPQLVFILVPREGNLHCAGIEIRHRRRFSKNL